MSELASSLLCSVSGETKLASAVPQGRMPGTKRICPPSSPGDTSFEAGDVALVSGNENRHQLELLPLTVAAASPAVRADGVPQRCEGSQAPLQQRAPGTVSMAQHWWLSQGLPVVSEHRVIFEPGNHNRQRLPVGSAPVVSTPRSRGRCPPGERCC